MYYHRWIHCLVPNNFATYTTQLYWTKSDCNAICSLSHILDFFELLHLLKFLLKKSIIFSFNC